MPVPATVAAPVATPTVATPTAATPTAATPTAATPPADPREPGQEIGSALGPISGIEPPAPTRAPENGASGTTGIRVLPLLSFDAPSAFAPRSLAGRLRDAQGPVVVQVAIRRGTPSRGCGWWNARTARFGPARRGACATERWITASVRPAADGLRWRAALGGRLPDGSYRYAVRILDAAGHPLSFMRV